MNSLITRIHSGGAPGADEAWVKAAEDREIGSLIFSFDGHREGYKKQLQGFPLKYFYVDVWEMEQEELAGAKDKIEDANARLQRDIEHLNQFSKNLLARNYYITEKAWMTVAIASSFDQKNEVAGGGTGWTVEFSRMAGLPTYVFSLKSEIWWSLHGDGTPAQQMEQRPLLQGIVACVGARKLTDAGRREILACINNSVIIQD